VNREVRTVREVREVRTVLVRRVHGVRGVRLRGVRLRGMCAPRGVRARRGPERTGASCTLRTRRTVRT
jgi:hypothetical protein